MHVAIILGTIILHVAFTIAALLMALGIIEVGGREIGLMFLVLGLIVTAKTGGWMEDIVYGPRKH